MEGTLRCTLGSQAQHTLYLEDHTWSIQQSTPTHTKHFHNIQQQNINHTQTHCELFHKTIHQHCQICNTQDKQIHEQSNTQRKRRPLHNKHSHRPTHSHYNRHKTNMRHIHTSIVSRHLATRGNNKILRTPPPHTSSSEEILPCLTRRTLAQLRTNKSPFLKSYLHKVDAKHIHHHYAPSVTSTHTTHIMSSTAPTYAPHCRPCICGQTPTE